MIDLKNDRITHGGHPWTPTRDSARLVWSLLEPFEDQVSPNYELPDEDTRQPTVVFDLQRKLAWIEPPQQNLTQYEFRSAIGLFDIACAKELPDYLGFTIRARVSMLPKPKSAWLCFDDCEFYPDPEDITFRYSFHYGSRTCSPHVETGDSVFVYFTQPRKALSLIGRAIGSAYYQPETAVVSMHDVDPHQWLCDVSSLVEIEPIPYSRLRDLHGGNFNLKGRSGKPIAPTISNEIIETAQVIFSPFDWCTKAALQPIVGRADLPAPDSMTLKDLRELPCSLLRHEKEVEQYVVEPLVRLTGILKGDVSLIPQYGIGRKFADYAIESSGEIKSIIEAKLRCRLPRDGDWQGSPDLRQAAGYANALDCPFLIVDAENIYCFAGDTEPDCSIPRHDLRREELKVIRGYLLGS